MSQHYIGTELELFAEAKRWKTYFGSVLRPFVAGHVLEVGAGIGSNTQFLYNERVASWTSLEPDPSLAQQIEKRITAGRLPRCRVITGTLESIDENERFDTILYIDVLEHLSDDAAELFSARRRLAPAGHVIVLAPAHQMLFSAFDSAIGHHRRYSRKSLIDVGPKGCQLIMCCMLDCAGLLASLANRVLLSQPMPSRSQIAFWDGWLVPISRRLDAAFGRRLGKTVVAVWRADLGADRFTSGSRD
jgi:SAM-dependent methyltransferase